MAASSPGRVRPFPAVLTGPGHNARFACLCTCLNAAVSALTRGAPGPSDARRARGVFLMVATIPAHRCPRRGSRGYKLRGSALPLPVSADLTRARSPLSAKLKYSACHRWPRPDRDGLRQRRRLVPDLRPCRAELRPSLLLWTLLRWYPWLYVNQERCGASAPVHRVVHARLYIDRFGGRFWGTFRVIDLFLAELPYPGDLVHRISWRPLPSGAARC